jgi:Uma2 family endonuclease
MQSLETKPLLLDVHSVTLRVTHEEFEKLCQDNPDLRLELTKEGQLITMAPAGWESSKRNSKLNSRVDVWNEQIDLGEVFDSSGGFTLPNGAVRSPDVTWIQKSKLEGISSDIAFPEVVPDFVIELRSKTDSLKTLREKMEEYRSNGVRLGLLINPKNKQVEIYRPGQESEILESPTSLVEDLPLVIDCGEVMPGFVLDMSKIW